MNIIFCNNNLNIYFFQHDHNFLSEFGGVLLDDVWHSDIPEGDNVWGQPVAHAGGVLQGHVPLALTVIGPPHRQALAARGTVL